MIEKTNSMMLKIGREWKKGLLLKRDGVGGGGGGGAEGSGIFCCT